MGKKTIFILGTVFGTLISELTYGFGWVDGVISLGVISIISIYAYILGVTVGKSIKGC